LLLHHIAIIVKLVILSHLRRLLLLKLRLWVKARCSLKHRLSIGRWLISLRLECLLVDCNLLNVVSLPSKHEFFVHLLFLGFGLTTTGSLISFL
jgi:hypothetical protein